MLESEKVQKRKPTTNNRWDISLGHRSQLEGSPRGQIRDNLSSKIKDSNEL